jgi:SAM-dependent methyltransferase
VSYTYGAVDAGDDPEGAADWQDRIDAWPAIAAYKEHMRGLLPREGRVLDVGCGPGGDLVAIGVERSVGVDPSVTMCRRAGARGGRVLRSDAVALPFIDEAFAACRADRVLQHLRDPLAALRELVRVTRPGGAIAIADPNQETLTIDVDGVPRSLIERVTTLRRDVGYRNGRLASRLPALLTELGVDAVQVAAFPLVLTDSADAFGIATWPRTWHERGVAHFAPRELEAWERALRQAEGVRYALDYVVTAGRRI